MKTYTPPYKINSKILNLTTQIVENLTKLEFDLSNKSKPLLRKKNRIKTLDTVETTISEVGLQPRIKYEKR